MLSVMQTEALREFVGTVWGNPTLETNVTIIPKKLTNSGPRQGSMPIRNISLRFPSARSYHVYVVGRLGNGALHKLTMEAGKWVKYEDFCNQNDLSMRFGYLNDARIPDHAGIEVIYLNSTGLLFVIPDDDAGDTKELHLTLRSSRLVLDYRIVTKSYVDVIQSVKDVLATTIENDAFAEYREYLLDNTWTIRPTRAEINNASSIVVVDDDSVLDIIDLPLEDLDTYVVDSKGYLLLHYPFINNKLLLNVNDVMVVLVNDRVGHVIHTGAYPGTINQLTSNACGLSAEVVESALDALGWLPADTTIRLRLSTGGGNVLTGNFNYQFATKQLSNEQQYDALLGRQSPPEVLTAQYQHVGPRNKYLNADYDLVKSNVDAIYGIGELDRLFNVGVRPGKRVDNNFLNLINTRLKVAKTYQAGMVTRIYPPTLEINDSALWMEHTQPIRFETQSVLVANYVNMVIYNQSGGLAVDGVNYRISNGTVLPLSPIYILEMASSTSVYVEENNFKLYPVPNLKANMACCAIHVFADNVYLHPGIDYRLDTDGISLWKAIPHTTLELKMEPKFIEGVVEQGFIVNGTLSVNEAYLIEDPENYIIFIGDKLYFPTEIQWEEDYILSKATLTNGVPYTILKRLMNDYPYSFQEIGAKRKAHQDTLNDISIYANLKPPARVTDPSLYSDHYRLVSPFLVELLRRMASGEINYTTVNLERVGVRDIVGTLLLKELDNVRDPLAVNWNTPVIEIVPHAYSSPQPLTADGYSFLVQVNAVLLGNKVAFNNYYRIVS
jgi:hypothetical protein